MNMERVAATRENSTHSNKCFCWSAIFVGALVAIGLSFLLNLFAMTIGLAAFRPTQGGATGLALGGFLGLLIMSVATMFPAGWVTGYLARPYTSNRYLGILYGMTTWCVALVVAVILASSFAKFTSNWQSSLTHSASAMIRTTQDQSSSTPSQQINRNLPANNLLNQTITSTEDVANIIALSLFVLFISFFVGAVACCFGGYYGIHSKKNDLF